MLHRFLKVMQHVMPVVLVTGTLTLTPHAGAQDTGRYYPTTEWRTSTPEEQGMDSAQLLAALDFVEANELPIDSITVIRHGYVVLDAYYHPYTADMKHHLWPATESFIATLVGIAVDQGLIEGLDQPLLALFPDRTVANRTAPKEALTVGNLLTMSSGITCGPTDSLWQSILEAPDSLGYLLDLKLEFTLSSGFVE
jgi:CubicO group peptidase (beta-lactamase class C family)